MRTKITGIVLLFFLVAPTFLTYGWLQYQKFVVKKELKKQLIAGMDKDALVLLKFTKAETRTKLHWEHDAEFEFNGMMYDVVETVVKGDTLYYRCWSDQAETKINRQLKALAAGATEKNAENTDQQKRLLHFYQSLYHAQSTAWQPFVFPEQPKRENGPYLFQLPSPTAVPPTPPPDIS